MIWPCPVWSILVLRKRGTRMLKLHKTQEGSKLAVGLGGQLDAFTITGFLDVLTIQ